MTFLDDNVFIICHQVELFCIKCIHWNFLLCIGCLLTVIISLIRYNATFTDRTWRHHHTAAHYDQTGKSADLPTLPSRLFRRMKFTQTDGGTEERHSSNIDDFFGSIWSLRSKVSNKSPDTVRKIITQHIKLWFILI